MWTEHCVLHESVEVAWVEPGEGLVVLGGLQVTMSPDEIAEGPGGAYQVG